MSPEQRELCRLLSPLHERFCEKHSRADEIPAGSGNQARANATADSFSLAKFRFALDELWEAAKELDRSLKQRDRTFSGDLRKCESGTLSLGLLVSPEQEDARSQKKA